MATYTMKFRCTNCGRQFENEVRKGISASGMGGECPNCGIKDGAPGIGHFEVIKESPDQKPNYN